MVKTFVALLIYAIIVCGTYLVVKELLLMPFAVNSVLGSRVSTVGAMLVALISGTLYFRVLRKKSDQG